ncbi:peptide ABC transporter substrate-binding protein [Sporolactobacillus shoreicorticis]|uniref:Peptide ABC transporter substrate-binding protein n=1 Tax=Sporolactobacillus shoreicorticis TaxID=1923877 RepID=A0ABW5S725_9BACL|nr:peptide ABC transporter substrate-binding protein [Sporolactobacillus shoreicorticis]MCO7126670.1 peptide ABC transporter substrate-binding protein [Sporolactobacillus shoreicorticis]
MKKAKWSLVLSFVLALSLVLSACGSSSSKDSEKGSSSELAKDQTLTMSINADIPTLDPNLATDTTSTNAIEMTEAGLTRMHDNKFEWDLAKGAPKVSADKKTYTFTLRDAKWSDGKPITAQDFVYGWQRQNDPKAKPAYNFLFASVGIKNAAKIEDSTNKAFYGKYEKLGVKALDDKTLQVTLEQAAPPFFYSILSQPQFMPQREDFVKKQGNKYATSTDTLLYSGPFVLSKWEKGTGWTYKKNKDYWNAKSTKLQTVNFKVVKETGTAINMYKTGQSDIVQLSAEFIDQFKKQYPKEIQTATNPGTYYLYINEKTNKYLKNLNLRKALNAAIDRQGLTSAILNDGSVPSNYVVPKNFVNGPDGKDFRSKHPDGFSAGEASEAKTYWNKAKKELGIKTLKINFLSQDTSKAKQIDAYVANQIKKNLPGVTVDVNEQPWANYLKLNNEFKYDIAFSGWFPDYQDPMTYLDMWTTGNPMNTIGWSNKKFDGLIKDAQTDTADTTKRWNDLVSAEELMMSEYPIVPLFQQGYTWSQKSYVKGYSQPSYGPEFDFAKAYILKH